MDKDNEYKLPKKLNHFQKDLYIHLIDWKWKNITEEVGEYNNVKYDAFLPDIFKDKFPFLYPPILNTFNNHHVNFPFRIHIFFNHMASSQIANANLFLPILKNTNVDEILKHLKPDFKRIAKEFLDTGFRIEFWDEPYNNLNDKTKVSGTDSDIAIAYYNNDEELCLWLIEHKLAENEFTTCGGFTSKGNKSKNLCKKSFSEILKNKDLCYYHRVNKYKYWDITEKNKEFFPDHKNFKICPFKDGLNQLWRNQLLGLSIESDSRQPYKYVYFSVVRHPENTSLDESIKRYNNLINNNPKFSIFTSEDVLKAAENLNDSELNKWIKWYKKLYKIK